jgi:hypothetical protein
LEEDKEVQKLKCVWTGNGRKGAEKGQAEEEWDKESEVEEGKWKCLRQEMVKGKRIQTSQEREMKEWKKVAEGSPFREGDEGGRCEEGPGKLSEGIDLRTKRSQL